MRTFVEHTGLGESHKKLQQNSLHFRTELTELNKNSLLRILYSAKLHKIYFANIVREQFFVWKPHLSQRGLQVETVYIFTNFAFREAARDLFREHCSRAILCDKLTSASVAFMLKQ